MHPQPRSTDLEDVRFKLEKKSCKQFNVLNITEFIIDGTVPSTNFKQNNTQILTKRDILLTTRALTILYIFP